jgi:hypothetical protein
MLYVWAHRKRTPTAPFSENSKDKKGNMKTGWGQERIEESEKERDGWLVERDSYVYIGLINAFALRRSSVYGSPDALL